MMNIAAGSLVRTFWLVGKWIEIQSDDSSSTTKVDKTVMSFEMPVTTLKEIDNRAEGWKLADLEWGSY